MGHEIGKATQNLPSFERVKSFALIPEQFSIGNGLMTSTLEVKREKFVEKYGILLESLYLKKEIDVLHKCGFVHK
jgi:long-chain acyl-CoA synthetase